MPKSGTKLRREPPDTLDSSCVARSKKMIDKFLARQLSTPSGVFGRWILAPLWNRRNSASNDAAFKSLVLQPDDRVLEVGFGGGYLLGQIAAVVTRGLIAGVDASETMVTLSEKHYESIIRTEKLEVLLAPAEALPYANGFFSKVCTVNSLFCWTDVP